MLNTYKTQMYYANFIKKRPMDDKDGSVQGFHFVCTCVISQTPTNQPAQNAYH